MTVSADMLWHDLGVFEQLHRKTAATICALERAVRQRSLDGDGDFLANCSLVAGEGAPPQVCATPSALAWCHRAYDLMRAAGASSLQMDRQLSQHLDAFKLFVAGSALLIGANRRLAAPLPLRRPVMIPGTRLRLSGPPTLALHGVQDNALLVSTDDAAPHRLPAESAIAGVELRSIPVARYGGAEIALGADVFELPGVEPADVRSAVPAGSSYQQQCAPMVEQALASVERHGPALFVQMRRALVAMVVKPRASGEFQGISFSDFPGAFIISYVAHPYLIAEGMVHEFHHNRLFAIENAMPLVEQMGTEAALYYSPFRPDPRPIRGLLHGLYVFVAVWRFWDKVRRAPDVEPLLRTFAVDRMFRIAFQLAIARRQLSTHPGLTKQGQAALAILARDVDDIVATVDRSGHGMDSPAAFCSEEGVMRIEVDEVTGAPLTVADALRLQRHRLFAAIQQDAAVS